MGKSSKFLKVTGIFMIIGGCFAIISGAFVFSLGAFVVFSDMYGLSELTSKIGRFSEISFGISVLGGIVQLITGFAGVRISKKPEKANTCIILGIVTTVFFITSHILGSIGIGALSTFDLICVILGLLVPIVYLISAIRLKTKIDLVEVVIERKEMIFEIFFTFIICGFIGWLFETVEVWIHYGTLTDRGILFISWIGSFPIVWGLPFIMMYGIGGAVLIWCFKPLKNEPVRLFFIGMFVLTVFEYVTSVICEYAWGLILWDYSHLFMNFQGRICISSSLAWGILSVVSVKLLSPLFHRMYNKITNVRILHAMIILLLVYIAVCYSLRHVLFPGMV